MYFISEYQGVFFTRHRIEFLQGNAALGLFDAYDAVPRCAKLLDSRGGIVDIFPRYGARSAECRFFDFTMGRRSRYTTQKYSFNGKPVGGSESSTDIVHTPDVVQYQGNRQPVLCLKCLE